MSVQREIDAELRFHFDARIDELVEQGMSRADAHAQAVAEFGDVNDVRANLREIDRRVARKRNRAERFDGIRQDVVYAARSLRRTPAVSLTIIATLALGLGANAAMFSLLDAIFLRPPAVVAHPETLRRVWAERRVSSGTEFWGGFNYSAFTAISQSVDGQANVALYGSPALRKLAKGENAPTAAVSGAGANYFAVVGVKPQLGRFYTPDEDRLDGSAPVAVVSDAFWKRELGGRQSAIGEQITISDERLTIIGVTPPRFSGSEIDATEVWVPMGIFFGPMASPRGRWWQNPFINGFRVILRLLPNAREGELVQRTTVALRGPGMGGKRDTLAVAAFGSIIAARGPGNLKAEVKVATRLAGVAVIVLLIACANVMNLLLARAVRRRREIAVRLALGVSRGRLVRMLITESVLLAIVATVAALVAATWGGSLLRQLLMPEVHFAESPLHWRVFMFALVLAVIAGALAGLIPALQSASPDLANALKAGSRAGVTYRSRLRGSLVAVQAALSVVLLVGAVLFVRSLHNVKAHDVGYAIDRLVFAEVDYDTPDALRDATMSSRLQALAPRVEAVPGVERVAFTSTRPKWGFSLYRYHPDFDTAGKKQIPPGIYTAVSSNYFTTTGTRLLRGKSFPDNAGESSPYTVIVNQAMADALWPNQDPIGHCIYFDRRTQPNQPPPPPAVCSTVIGVAQTALLSSLAEKPDPQFYVSLGHMALDDRGAKAIVVRAKPDQRVSVQKNITELLRSEFSGAVPALTTMEKTMEPEYRPWQLGATLFTLFGVLALTVAGLGIYSTVSYAVSQRTHEFGVRVALGARAADVLRQVLAEGLRTVAIGVVIGILMALAAGKLVESLLYGIAASDPSTIVIVAVVLLVIAALAALMPAWRAAKADPVAALRAD
jgi:putative ABC transport system permease protein